MIQRPPDHKLSEISALATEAAWTRAPSSPALRRLHELLDGPTIHWLVEEATAAEELRETVDLMEEGC